MLPVFYFPLPIAIGTQISAEINQIYSDIFVFLIFGLPSFSSLVYSFPGLFSILYSLFS